MRCKQGDLAIVIQSSPSRLWAIGRIVTCLKPHTNFAGLPGWETDLVDPTISKTLIIYDGWLRPLRGDLTGEQDLYALPKPEPKEVGVIHGY